MTDHLSPFPPGPPSGGARFPAHGGPPPQCPAHRGGAGAPYDAAFSGAVALHGPENEADSFALYERLRARHGAVAPVVVHGGLPAWLVLGYQENLEVMRNPSRYSRDSRRWRDWREGRVPADSPLLPMVGWRPDCVSADGREHKRLRGAVTESLDRLDHRGFRRHITRFADELIDRFSEDGEAELLHQYARRLPILVLTHLLGMPEEDGPRLVEAARHLITGTDKALESNAYVLATLAGLVARKRAEPGNDLASWLMAHPSGLDDDEVLHHLRLVLLAGNETTTNLMASTLRMVLTDRRFRASLAGSLITVPEGVEQLLWDEPPLMVCPARWATGDTELAGQPVGEGDMLLLCLAGGNADPAVRPDTSAQLYGNRAHLSFSRGPHECPGQEIGRAITDAGVDVLLTRLPDLRLAVPEAELTWTCSAWSRYLDALPARFTPRRAAGRPDGGRPGERRSEGERPEGERAGWAGAESDGGGRYGAGAGGGAAVRERDRRTHTAQEPSGRHARRRAAPDGAPSRRWARLLRRWRGRGRGHRR